MITITGTDKITVCNALKEYLKDSGVVVHISEVSKKPPVPPVLTPSTKTAGEIIISEVSSVNATATAASDKLEVIRLTVRHPSTSISIFVSL